MNVHVFVQYQLFAEKFFLEFVHAFDVISTSKTLVFFSPVNNPISLSLIMLSKAGLNRRIMWGTSAHGGSDSLGALWGLSCLLEQLTLVSPICELLNKWTS